MAIKKTTDIQLAQFVQAIKGLGFEQESNLDMTVMVEDEPTRIVLDKWRNPYSNMRVMFESTQIKDDSFCLGVFFSLGARDFIEHLAMIKQFVAKDDLLKMKKGNMQ